MADDVSPTTGFTRYVTVSEFKQYCKTNDNHNLKMDLALWGEDGRGGIVKITNDMSLQQRILIGIILFIQPLLFALILKWFGM